jgi:malate dehydrogenase (oxaloacetate-decarboxylating)
MLSVPHPRTQVVPTSLSGQLLLDCGLLNKGTAFTEEERRQFHLNGLLPPKVETLDEQALRAYEAYRQKDTDLERHIFLRALQDHNEVLFYRLVFDHLPEMLPVVYTPVVAQACANFSHIFRRPRGLFLAYPMRDRLEAVLENRPYKEVDVVVVTDGERILGIGDQGAGGMGIPIGKLSLYSLVGGVYPARTLPVLLDVGTNNPERLRDPLYLGWRHERVRGPAYDDFVETFVEAVRRQLPHVLLQWEDFSGQNARPLLDRYRDRLCSFNDDIQGTAAVTLGALTAAVRVTCSTLADQQVVIVGAGSAGTGVADYLLEALIAEGVPEAEAKRRLWLVKSNGLVHSGMTNLTPAQRKYAQPEERLAGWRRDAGGAITLEELMPRVRATALIGVSAQPRIFTEPLVRTMAAHVARPIIFPLSNPDTRSEAEPADLLRWTEGRALVATGTAYPPVTYGDRTFAVGQCNNVYIFPAVGLAVSAVGIHRITDSLLLAAARALAECSPALHDTSAPLLPALADIRAITRRIALAVVREAERTGLVEKPLENPEAMIAASQWTPQYRSYRHVFP